MASPALPIGHLSAGQQYLKAVRNLGLRPNFAGWGWETVTEQWLFVLVTPIVEAGGPLALNELLFKAYNAEATPKEISPFIVRVYSPEVITHPNFWMLGQEELWVEKVQNRLPPEVRPPPDSIKVENVQFDFLGVHYQSKYSYKSVIPERNTSYHAKRDQWDLFKRNVEKLAA